MYNCYNFLQDLLSVGPRFEHELTSDPFNLADEADCGSRILDCYTLDDTTYQLPGSGTEHSFGDGKFPLNLQNNVDLFFADLSVSMFNLLKGIAQASIHIRLIFYFKHILVKI